MRELILILILSTSAQVFAGTCDSKDRVCNFLVNKMGGYMTGKQSFDPEVQEKVFMEGINLLDSVSRQPLKGPADAKKILLLAMRISWLQNDEYAVDRFTTTDNYLSSKVFAQHTEEFHQAFNEITHDKTFSRGDTESFCEMYPASRKFFGEANCPLPQY